MFETLGSKIRLLRTEHNMSQADLARKLEVSSSTVSRWERSNGYIPTTKSLLDICRLFHVSLHFLTDTESEAVIAIDTLTETQQKLLIMLTLELKNKK